MVPVGGLEHLGWESPGCQPQALVYKFPRCRHSSGGLAWEGALEKESSSCQIFPIERR